MLRTWPSALHSSRRVSTGSRQKSTPRRGNMTFSESPLSIDALQAKLKEIEEQTRTAVRVTTTKARIAQTPKEVIWTLNKAKLYRYTPVVPKEQRHRVPLFLVFALMNRPSILDLRP